LDYSAVVNLERTTWYLPEKELSANRSKRLLLPTSEESEGDKINIQGLAFN
jgi:hypothetical protein